MPNENKEREVREQEDDRVVVAPEGMADRQPPRSLGEVPLDHDVDELLLQAIAWHNHGDREASDCSVYVYDDDLEAVRKGLGVSVERFDDGEYGQGYRFVMRPVVDTAKLPETRMEEDEAGDGEFVEFEIGEDFTPEAGIALMRGTGLNDEPITAESEFGDMAPAEIIGLLTVTLDQYRYDFIDKSGRPTN